MTQGAVTKAAVRKILERPLGHEWSLQGFGMLRLYLSDELRMHVWDSRYAAEGVSEVHTHPWNFHSLVVAGKVVNQRLVESEAVEAVRYNRRLILCGTGGGLCDTSPECEVGLLRFPEEVYYEGCEYTQKAEEIHISAPADGTVTVVEREFLDDADHAFVYWPAGTEWGTAEPRTATAGEVQAIAENALKSWF